MTAASLPRVREALAGLHDPAALERHPFAAAVGGGRALRRALEDAIDALAPRAGKGGSRAGRRHRLLTLRYLEALPVDEVQRHLLIGRSEYYREHERAVAAVAALLGERSVLAYPPAVVPDPGGAAARAVEAAADVTSQGRLPIALTSFIGRDDDLAEIERLLATSRLLTLTGAGGCGKTRLALEAAARLADGYPDGVRLVELAPLTDPALVPSAVAAALGVREAPGEEPIEMVLRGLAGRRRLLLLDNCEHLVDACAQLVHEVLRSCPGVRVLATSRETLRVAGEVSWRVPPLPVPPAGSRLPADQQSWAPSVRLFVDRASAVSPGFLLTEQTSAAVADICRQLDGLPLALELAAVRVRMLPVEQIAARLGDRFRLLTGGSRAALRHQQTLRASIAWSHDLLSEPERVLFRSLAAFAGGWTLEAAEALGGDVMDVLASLVDKSLVLAEGHGGQERYRMLETIREYALEQLAESGEAATTRGLLADYYLALCERAEPGLLGTSGRSSAAWLDRLEREHDNLRAALRWFVETGQVEPGLRMAGALSELWRIRGYVGEAHVWFDALLDQPGAPTIARARALFWAGCLWTDLDDERAGSLLVESLELARALDDGRTVARALVALGDVRRRTDAAESRRLVEAGLALGRALGDAWSISTGLLWMGDSLMFDGDRAAARRVFDECLDFSLQVANHWTVGASLEHLGFLTWQEGDMAAAAVFHRRALAVFKEAGDLPGVSHALLGGGLAALAERDVPLARALLTESLLLQRKLGERSWVPLTLRGFAGLAAVEGRGPSAVRLFGAHEALSPLAAQPEWVAQHEYNRDVALARAALDEATFRAAWAEGRAMSLETALAFAMGDDTT